MKRSVTNHCEAGKVIKSASYGHTGNLCGLKHSRLTMSMALAGSRELHSGLVDIKLYIGQFRKLEQLQRPVPRPPDKAANCLTNEHNAPDVLCR